MTTAIKPRLLLRRKFGHCPECKSNLLHHCAKNGVMFVQGGRENPVAIWNADIYRCPCCGNLVLTDFADRPQWTIENTPDIKGLAQGFEAAAEIVIYGK